MRRHHRIIRGRSSVAPSCAWALAASTFGALVLAASPAGAQPTDTANARPNVLILLDSSGSMELMMDGTAPEAPTASPVMKCDGTQESSKNRWGTQLEALTGSLSSYGCMKMARAPGSSFDQEYSLYASHTKYWNGGTNGALLAHPYDLNYFLDYHRPAVPVSSGVVCAIGFDPDSSHYPTGGGITHGWDPGNTTTHSTTDFASAYIQGYLYNVATGVPTTNPPTACSFTQSTNGLIDQASSAVRFGVMTFDSDTDPATGVAVTNAATIGGCGYTAVGGSANPTTGMWSYFNGWETGTTTASRGRPAGCTTTPYPFFEVGARSWAAPPWEGPLVPFPDSTSVTPDPDPSITNAIVKQTILAMRPYGANPIAGLLDDAKNYYWVDGKGPRTDVLKSCRKNFIILLSHAAPNDDLQPYCRGNGTATPDGGTSSDVGGCPYDFPESITSGLYTGAYTPTPSTNSGNASASGPSVSTYVVGFSLSSGITNGSGSTGSCNDILVGTAPNFTGYDATKCGGPGIDPPSTYSAYKSCCTLAKIAASGGTKYPYFADSQADLNNALAAILSNILENPSTRAVPVPLSQTVNNSSAGGASSAIFLSSFTPSRVEAWSGDVQRQRYQCTWSNGAWAQQQQAIDTANTSGDDFQQNLDTTQSTARYVLLAYPNNTVTTTTTPPTTLTDRHLSAQYMVRPWINGVATSASSAALDGYVMNDSKEYVFSYTAQGHSELVPVTTFTSDALFGSTVCPINKPATLTPFLADDCNRIAFGFALGAQNAPATWDTSRQPFPARYAGVGALPSSSFGGVYHSTPAIATPPGALLRDDSYQGYVQNYATNYTTYNNAAEPRHTVLYVATIDGVLHAFGADYKAGDNYTFNGTHDPTGKANEMWSFIPPAVMPHLLDGFPAAQTPILDGTPVVKDTIYQRATVGDFSDWHTTLVSALGGTGSIGLGGYYALDVTDPDITRHAASGTAVDPSHSTVNSGFPPYMSTTSKLPQGPHFLWQLSGDPYLFGKYGATPTITTLLMDPGDGVKREIGVAILPGGGTDLAGSTTTCARIAKVTPTAVPIDTNYDLQNNVRQWQGGCNATRGRTLSIVRLDTGEILRVFGNAYTSTNHDLPDPTATPTWGPYAANSGTIGTNPRGFAFHGRFTDARFDSPIVGTPVAYPNDVGSDAQRIYVGDADGVLWRLDVSDPDPTHWFVEPFWDSFNLKIQGTSSMANHTVGDVWGNSRQPIVAAPSLAIGRTGNVVLNFATGDVNQLGNNTGLYNYVFSLSEVPDATSAKLRAGVNWWKVLPNAGELVSGPSAVFDGTYYFATYVPNTTTNLCSHGEAFLWGMDYQDAASSTLQSTTQAPDPPSFGGGPKLLDASSNQVQLLDTGSPAILPGIAVTSTAACAQDTAVDDYYTGGTRYDLQNSAPATYSVSALVGQQPTGTGAAAQKVGQYNYTMASGVRTMTLVDSWASIVE